MHDVYDGLYAWEYEIIHDDKKTSYWSNQKKKKKTPIGSFSLMSPRGDYPNIFPPKKKKFLGQTRENKSYKSAKLRGYSPRPADLTDTGQLPITSRHYGFKSTETSDSTASSRRQRQRFLCNSHSLLILHRHICHGTYYISNYINS